MSKVETYQQEIMDAITELDDMTPIVGSVGRNVAAITHYSTDDQYLSANTVDLAIAALRAQLEPGWIKVSDPPKETGTYLVVYEAKPESWSHTGPELALWDGERWGCDWDCGDFNDYVTHWMPLPESPKEGEE